MRAAAQAWALVALATSVAVPCAAKTFSAFSIGGSSARLAAANGSYATCPTALGVLAFGWKIGERPFYAMLEGETFRIYQIDPMGTLTGDGAPRHEGIGLGTGLLWSINEWQIEAALVQGKVQAEQESPNGPRRHKFSYFTPRIEAGFALFSSAGARIALNVGVRRVMLSDLWHEQYGYKDIWAAHALAALYLTVARDHRFFESD